MKAARAASSAAWAASRVSWAPVSDPRAEASASPAFVWAVMAASSACRAFAVASRSLASNAVTLSPPSRAARASRCRAASASAFYRAGAVLPRGVEGGERRQPFGERPIGRAPFGGAGAQPCGGIGQGAPVGGCAERAVDRGAVALGLHGEVLQRLIAFGEGLYTGAEAAECGRFIGLRAVEHAAGLVFGAAGGVGLSACVLRCVACLGRGIAQRGKGGARFVEVRQSQRRGARRKGAAGFFRASFGGGQSVDLLPLARRQLFVLAAETGLLGPMRAAVRQRLRKFAVQRIDMRSVVGEVRAEEGLQRRKRMFGGAADRAGLAVHEACAQQFGGLTGSGFRLRQRAAGLVQSGLKTGHGDGGGGERLLQRSEGRRHLRAASADVGKQRGGAGLLARRVAGLKRQPFCLTDGVDPGRERCQSLAGERCGLGLVPGRAGGGVGSVGAFQRCAGGGVAGQRCGFRRRQFLALALRLAAADEGICVGG